MYSNTILFVATMIFSTKSYGQNIYVSDINFRIEPGSRMCVFESGKAGQMLEVYYQVLDGQHGDLDITFELTDPNEVNLVTDIKSSENSIIMNLEVDGDYAFCMDNTYSLINSKLVFLFILVEDTDIISKVEAEVTVEDGNGTETSKVEAEVTVKDGNGTETSKVEAEVTVKDGNGTETSKVEAEVTVRDSNGTETSKIEAEVTVEDGNSTEKSKVLEWQGVDENGQAYYVEVAPMADSLSRTLGHVVKSRRLLNIYAATKSRDSYMAFEDTFIVDVWSSFQIFLMFVVGMLQVYMIKKLFNTPQHGYKSIY